MSSIVLSTVHFYTPIYTKPIADMKKRSVLYYPPKSLKLKQWLSYTGRSVYYRSTILVQ